MEENAKRTEISQLGEFGLIDHLAKSFTLNNESSILGIGDDAAIISNGSFETVVTTDLLLEGIHFDLMYHPLKHLGYKAVVVNLSDVCAMNATPKQITVSLGLSNRFSLEAVDELYAGIHAACKFYGVDLVGGDTASSRQGLVISVTAIGQVEESKKTLRSTAKKGDILCVSGDLGAAYLGLQLLEREKQVYLSEPDMKPDLEDQQYVVGRQLKPEARLDMIEQLAKAAVIPTSMIDVSDGLSSDLMHICKQSGLGAIVEETGVPIHPEAQLLAIKFNLDPITCALSGGEDYELLFTIDAGDLPKVRLMSDVYMLGEMVDASDGIKLHTKGGNIHNITAQGWD
ncbi:MAG: thiamine-phosphate kinase, partial [Saprospiraceae bacterium]|nr:thiamine-phosphate kinase [Saprospiraceae bacterium]